MSLDGSEFVVFYNFLQDLQQAISFHIHIFQAFTSGIIVW